ncbi:phosphotransferase [Streptomyces sp. NPDC001513]|uniref:phosphotransferase n=1 Tax=Streptomyces sp. NPDC001513 TaxID=3364580 RepID=UPI0036B93427
MSWAREERRAWRADGAEDGEWYVKIHQNDRFHRREVDALRNWLFVLGASAPRLATSDAQLRAVVLTGVGGRSLHGAVYPPEQQRRIFRRIGQLAAVIHDSAPPRPAAESPPLGRLEWHLARALPHARARRAAAPAP